MKLKLDPDTLDQAKQIILAELRAHAAEFSIVTVETLPILQRIAADSAEASFRKARGDPTADVDLAFLKAQLALIAVTNAINEAERFEDTMITVAKVAASVLGAILLAAI
jgi:hypothetical protein